MVLDRVACSLAIVMGPNLQFVTETRAELLDNKEKLLPNGDPWESLLSKQSELDAPYRSRWSNVP